MCYIVAIAGLDKELVELSLQVADIECIGVFDVADIGDTLGRPWLGPDSEWRGVLARYPETKVVIGLDQPALRQRLSDHFGKSVVIGIRSDAVHISEFATVCPTAIVQSGVRIHADAKVGYCCKINHDAVIHHDSKVGDYCTISPGARLLGNTRLSNRVFIGAGAIILPHVSIGQDVTVGGGAVVTKDIASGQIVAGVPARKLEFRKGTGI